MSVDESAAPRQANIRACLIAAGACLFVVSFFVPAVQMARAPISGFQCAINASRLSVTELEAMLNPRSSSGGWGPSPAASLPAIILLFSSELINPLILLYFFLSRKYRGIVAIAIFADMVATWTFLLMFRMKPLIGHYLWILGVLLMLASELFNSLDEQAA